MCRIYGALIYGISVLQSAPRIIVQIVITGTQIFGKALLEAARQAAKSVSPFGFHVNATKWLRHSWFADAKHRPQGAIGSEVAGVGNATTGSLTDKLTREHRMTLDEAHLILNAKREESIEKILQVRPLSLGLLPARADLLFIIGRIRTTNTYLRQTRHRKWHRQVRQADGARRYLGIHTTCSQRWCGRGNGSRQS